MKTRIEMDSEGRVAGIGNQYERVRASVVKPLIRQMPGGNCSNNDCNCTVPAMLAEQSLSSKVIV